MLKNLLNTEVVQVVEQGQRTGGKRWAISCRPLIENGSYRNRVMLMRSIARTTLIGPYYVVGPGIAMPHARPEEGANKLSLALTLIPSGVNFDADENDPVKLLIVLAATDSTSHIEAISQLAKLFDNEKDIQAILMAKTTQDILSVIARY